MEVPITQPILREDRHVGDYARFPAMHCYIQAQTMPEVWLAHTATVFDNPRNYVLALYVSIEPSEIYDNMCQIMY